MFRVAYRSSLCSHTKAADVQRIVKTAHSYNPDQKITGAWMLHEGECLAAIEGPPIAVRELMDAIWDDPRHSNVELVAMEQCEHRLFKGWPLRFLPKQELKADPKLAEHEGVSWLAEFAGGVDTFYLDAAAQDKAGAPH